MTARKEGPPDGHESGPVADLATFNEEVVTRIVRDGMAKGRSLPPIDDLIRMNDAMARLGFRYKTPDELAQLYEDLNREADDSAPVVAHEPARPDDNA